MKPSSKISRNTESILQSELKSKAKLLNEIRRISHVGTWQFDFTTLKAEWSTEAFHILGLKKDSIMPSLETFLSYVHPSDVGEVQKTISDHEGTGENYSFFCRIKSANGKIKHTFCRGLFEKNRKGKPVRLYGIIHDITEVKELQNKISLSEMMGQEHERERLSKELHDGLGQMLVGINFRLGNAEHNLQNKQAFIATEIHKINSDVRDIIKEVCSISHNLSPHLLRKYGLAESLRNICASAGVTRMSFVNKLNATPSDAIAMILYRISQEVISNIHRHSKAKSGKLTINDTSKEIRLLIEDNGVGFRPGTDKDKTGIGMESIRNRLALVDGQFRIAKGKNGKGSRVEIRIPVR